MPSNEDEGVLDLTNDQEVDAGEIDSGDDDEALIGFAGEDDQEVEETPVIKRLREQNRELAKKLRQRAVPQNDEDPAPVVPKKPTLEDCDYDPDRFEAAVDAYDKAKDDYRDWQNREEARKSDRERQDGERARKIEQQKSALGVRDFDARATEVKDRLSPAQLAILIEGADNPAQMIYALGRSPTRLEMLATEENMAKFAVMIGRMEKDIKVSKKSPPPPEGGRVRGATASVSMGDKELERLEKEADRTGDRSKIIAYNRAKRQAA